MPLHLIRCLPIGGGRWVFWLQGLTLLPPLGRGEPPPLGVATGRLLLRASVSLRKVGAPAVRTLVHGVLTPAALLGPAPLYGEPVVPRRVSLRTPAAASGGAGALWLNVAPLTAVAASDIWSFLLEGLGLISTTLEP